LKKDLLGTENLAGLINCPVARKKAGRGKAVETEDEAVSGLADVKNGFAKDAVFGRPMRDMCAPIDVEVGLVNVKGVDDEGGAGKVAGRTDDFGGVPAVLMHDPGRIIDVLDRVLGLYIFENCRCRHTPFTGKLRHDVRFNVLVMCSGAAHDDIRSDPGLVFADCFEHALALLRRGSTVRVGGIAEDNEGVEVSVGGVMRRNREIHARHEKCDCEDNGRKIKESSVQELHEVRVSGNGLLGKSFEINDGVIALLTSAQRRT
jgi:hypothetical protein